MQQRFRAAPVRVQLKAVNDEFGGACAALRTRVDALDAQKALVTRAASAAATTEHSSEEAVASVASHIVEESMAEAAALVHELFARAQPPPASSSPAPANGAAAPAQPAESRGSEGSDGTGAGAASKGSASDTGPVAEPASAAGGPAPGKVAMFVDDETLMHLSTKLTAMFIAIQRCALAPSWFGMRRVLCRSSCRLCTWSGADVADVG